MLTLFSLTFFYFQYLIINIAHIAVKRGNT
jgi:hypothetical protein